ncbi:MAG TPA: prohibitin family protein [Thermoanaerobaculia bacterium]|nr:prohibitin family protein [Thermoanaerobaculia bacterium]
MVDALRYEIGLPEESWADRHALSLAFTALLVIVIVAVFFDRMFVVIPVGHRGVAWSLFYGRLRDVPEGAHIVAPWTKLYVYDIRVQELTRRLPVLTSGELQIILDTSVRYRPRTDRLGDLHRRFGPNYADKLIVQELASALQDSVGDDDYRVFADPTVFSAAMNNARSRVNAQLANEPVIVEAVRITRVTLPPEIAKAINDKLREQQLAELYVHRIDQEKREAQRKEIEATGIRRFNDIVAQSLNDELLQWRGIEATLALAKSDNAKVVVIGKTSTGLPIIFDNNQTRAAAPRPQP